MHDGNETADDRSLPLRSSALVHPETLPGGALGPSRAKRSNLVQGAAAAVAFLGLALVARFDAGLADYWVLVGIATALPLYVASRGWKLGWWFHAVAAMLPIGVVVSAAVHSSWDGSARAARYAYGALLFLAIVSWATEPVRRHVVGLAVVILALDSYLTAWWIWWGGLDAQKSMYGNFYTQNVFATYLVMGVALGVFFVALGTRVGVFAGVIVTCLAGAGILASASRTGLMMLGAALMLAALAGFIARGWRSLVRMALLVGGIFATSWFMSGPLFFPDQVELLRAFSRTDGGFSIASRFSFWHDAPIFFAQSPVFGHGLKTFGPLIQCYSDGAYSSNPHNETLLAAAETGLVGALPFLAIIAGVVVLLLRVFRPVGDDGRRAWRAPTAQQLLADPAAWGGLVAMLAAFAHMHFDFDWAFPSIIALTALVAGIATAPYVARPSRGRLHVAFGLVCILALVGAATIGFALDPLPSQSLRPLPLAEFECLAG